jgi:glycosyltransferase involved in cell wall biosynthesis
MACGRPVVAPENAGCDLLEENDGEVGWLVPASDPEALAAVLQRYRERPGLAQQQGIAAAQAAQRIGGVGRFGRGYAAALRRLWLDWDGR